MATVHIASPEVLHPAYGWHAEVSQGMVFGGRAVTGVRDHLNEHNGQNRVPKLDHAAN
jgi:hypothetical protein